MTHSCKGMLCYETMFQLMSTVMITKCLANIEWTFIIDKWVHRFMVILGIYIELQCIISSFPPCIHVLHFHKQNVSIIPEISLIFLTIIDLCEYPCMHTFIYTCSYVCTQVHYWANYCSVIIQQKKFLCVRTSCIKYALWCMTFTLSV